MGIKIDAIKHRASEEVRCIAGYHNSNCPREYKDSLSTSVIKYMNQLEQEILERMLKEHLEIASRLQEKVDKCRKITRQHLDFAPDDFSRR